MEGRLKYRVRLEGRKDGRKEGRKEGRTEGMKDVPRNRNSRIVGRKEGMNM